MEWLFKHFFLKVILAAFLIIFGMSLVRCLAWIVIILTICAVIGILMVLNWMWSKVKEIFS